MRTNRNGCPRLLNEIRQPGNFARPDGPPYETQTPCKLPKGHPGKHEWSSVNRVVR